MCVAFYGFFQENSLSIKNIQNFKQDSVNKKSILQHQQADKQEQETQKQKYNQKLQMDFQQPKQNQQQQGNRKKNNIEQQKVVINNSSDDKSISKSRNSHLHNNAFNKNQSGELNDKKFNEITNSSDEFYPKHFIDKNKDNENYEIDNNTFQKKQVNCSIQISEKKASRKEKNFLSKAYSALPLNQPLLSEFPINPQFKSNFVLNQGNNVENMEGNLKQLFLKQQQTNTQQFQEDLFLNQTSTSKIFKEDKLQFSQFIVLNQIDTGLLPCNNYLVLVQFGDLVKNNMNEITLQISRLRDFLEQENIETSFNKLERAYCNQFF